MTGEEALYAWVAQNPDLASTIVGVGNLTSKAAPHGMIIDKAFYCFRETIYVTGFSVNQYGAIERREMPMNLKAVASHAFTSSDLPCVFFAAHNFRTTRADVTISALDEHENHHLIHACAECAQVLLMQTCTHQEHWKVTPEELGLATELRAERFKAEGPGWGVDLIPKQVVPSRSPAP